MPDSRDYKGIKSKIIDRLKSMNAKGGKTMPAISILEGHIKQAREVLKTNEHIVTIHLDHLFDVTQMPAGGQKSIRAEIHDALALIEMKVQNMKRMIHAAGTRGEEE